MSLSASPPDFKSAADLMRAVADDIRASHEDTGRRTPEQTAEWYAGLDPAARQRVDEFRAQRDGPPPSPPPRKVAGKVSIEEAKRKRADKEAAARAARSRPKPNGHAPAGVI